MYAFVLSTLGPWVDLWKASYTSKQFGSFHLAYIVPFLQWLDLAAVSPVYGICHLYSHISGNVSKQGPETFWSCIHQLYIHIYHIYMFHPPLIGPPYSFGKHVHGYFSTIYLYEGICWNHTTNNVSIYIYTCVNIALPQCLPGDMRQLALVLNSKRQLLSEQANKARQALQDCKVA